MKINKTLCDNCQKEIEARGNDRISIRDVGTFGICKYRTQGNGITARAADLCEICSANIAKMLWDSFQMTVEDLKEEGKIPCRK